MVVAAEAAGAAAAAAVMALGFPDPFHLIYCIFSGKGYNGNLCGRCQFNYFETASKTCARCPAVENNYDAFFSALWPFCTVLIVSSLLMFGTVLYLERKGMRHDTACSIAGRQVREFAIWVILSAQVMAVASSSPAPNLPDWILSVYAFVSFFNFDTKHVVHESCMNEKDPYLTSTLLLVGILILTVLQALLFIIAKLCHTENNAEDSTRSAKKKQSIWVARLQGILFITMSFAFPLVARNVLKFLHCETDAGEMVLADGSVRTVCWGKRHLPIGVLCIFVGVLYILAYPIASGFYLRKIVHYGFGITKSASRLARWEHFVSDDYQPRYYWFRHLYWAVNFSLLFVSEFLPHGIVRFCLIICIFAMYTILLFHYRPFALMDRWKLWVRVCLVVASILIALLNVVRWSEDIEEQNNFKGSSATYRTIAAVASTPSPSSVGGKEHGVMGSTVVAYLLFVVCMFLPILLPFSFFYTNYGVCNKSGHNVKQLPFKSTVEKHERQSLEYEMTNQTLRANSETDESNWTRHYDDSSGFFYLVHEITGASKWEEKEEAEEENIEIVNNPFRRNGDAEGEDGTEVEDEEDEEDEAERWRRKQYLAQAADLETPTTIDGWIEIVGDQPGTLIYCNLGTGEVLYKKPKKWVDYMRNHYNKGHVSSNSFKQRKDLAQRMMSASNNSK
jgi:heme/copper-type cytochrome/quinol oxidase subunit 2